MNRPFRVVFRNENKDCHGRKVFAFTADDGRNELSTYEFTVSTVDTGMRLMSASKDFHNYLSREEQEEIVAEARKMILAMNK